MVARILSSQKSQNVVNLTHMHLQTTEFVLVILPSVREKGLYLHKRKKKNNFCSIRLAVVKLLNLMELWK